MSTLTGRLFRDGDPRTGRGPPAGRGASSKPSRSGIRPEWRRSAQVWPGRTSRCRPCAGRSTTPWRRCGPGTTRRGTPSPRRRWGPGCNTSPTAPAARASPGSCGRPWTTRESGSSRSSSPTSARSLPRCVAPEEGPEAFTRRRALLRDVRARFSRGTVTLSGSSVPLPSISSGGGGAVVVSAPAPPPTEVRFLFQTSKATAASSTRPLITCCQSIRDAHQRHAVVEHTHDETTDDRADHRADAAGDGRAADERRGDRVELEVARRPSGWRRSAGRRRPGRPARRAGPC